MFRRKTAAHKVMPEPLRPAWEAFRGQAERVEAARTALLSCLSFGRAEPPVPIPVGLDLLDDELAAVASDLSAWRVAEVEAAWQACAESIDIARAQIPNARETAEATDDGSRLVVVLRDCVTPLDAWHDAERRWLDLRVRP